MRRRLLATLTYSILLLLVLAPVALAETENDGRGFYGATNDKVVTNAGFILIIFFPTFVFLMSMLQKRLETPICLDESIRFQPDQRFTQRWARDVKLFREIAFGGEALPGD